MRDLARFREFGFRLYPRRVAAKLGQLAPYNLRCHISHTMVLGYRADSRIEVIGANEVSRLDTKVSNAAIIAHPEEVLHSLGNSPVASIRWGGVDMVNM